jgi:polyhydroxyalkanoate synthase subunit PhaC
VFGPFASAPPADGAPAPGVPSVDGLLAAAPREAMTQFVQWAMQSPVFAELALRAMRDQATLWQRMLAREQGGSADPVQPPEAGDRRFAAAEWTTNAFYDYVKQGYLIQSRFLKSAVEAAQIGEHDKRQLGFFARQYIDALSPANYVATNPDALRAALATNGDTLKRGMQQLIDDIGRGRISTVDESAFEVGRNLAITPGAVVFENELFQLIQYAPSSAPVHARPLLMVPPCINKFYVLDLQPDNSFVRYAVEQGHTVFIVSWRNPTEELGHITWDDYIERGVITAIETVRAIRPADRMNVLGFCVGGTLLSTSLAVLAARGKDYVASLTLLATLLDFTDTGEIGCFVSEQSVASREAALGGGGLLSGRELMTVFSALRDNDLIWSYVVANYLKGERPAAFDILYWNADSTNLPGPMFAWYLRNMYLENRLREPGALTVCGEKVDLARIAVPAYIVATREDHIVPWQSAYASTGLLKGENRFVLGASGHIAGIINPAAKGKRSYWIGAQPIARRPRRGARSNESSAALAPEAWMASAVEHPGSWWTDWSTWLATHAGPQVAPPRVPGDSKRKVIEPAPGRYVKFRIV